MITTPETLRNYETESQICSKLANSVAPILSKEDLYNWKTAYDAYKYMSKYNTRKFLEEYYQRSGCTLKKSNNSYYVDLWDTEVKRILLNLNNNESK